MDVIDIYTTVPTSLSRLSDTLIFHRVVSIYAYNRFLPLSLSRFGVQNKVSADQRQWTRSRCFRLRSPIMITRPFILMCRKEEKKMLKLSGMASPLGTE